MKKIILLLIFAFAINSCSTETYQPDTSLLVLPIDSVIMPASFATDSTSVIKIKYRRPSNCYGFNGFYYAKHDFTRTVAIEAVLFNQGGCELETDNLKEVELRFTPVSSGTYNFKFWLGNDVNNVEQYLIVDAIVP